jgi:hypothetical protein
MDSPTRCLGAHARCPRSSFKRRILVAMFSNISPSHSLVHHGLCLNILQQSQVANTNLVTEGTAPENFKASQRELSRDPTCYDLV